MDISNAYRAPGCGCGDIDCDGRITMNDYILAQQYRLHPNPNPDILKRGDLNRNGIIDDDDIQQIREIAEMRTNLLKVGKSTVALVPYSEQQSVATSASSCSACTQNVKMLSIAAIAVGAALVAFGARR